MRRLQHGEYGPAKLIETKNATTLASSVATRLVAAKELAAAVLNTRVLARRGSRVPLEQWGRAGVAGGGRLVGPRLL
eukprot:357381-Pleurochrysis_carterae.AAC.1